ncbi:MAG: DUF3291 domain-containing protein [Pseudomonadota bacterium]
MDTTRHLAQLNIGRMVAPKGDPAVAEFFDNLERVNAAADSMPGFVWRLQDDGGDATEFRFGDDPDMLVNLSVWETSEALATYVFKTVHARFYRKRDRWFVPLADPHFCMWWVPVGHRPDLAEAHAMLTDYKTHGASERVFGWSNVPEAALWRSERCA